MAIQETQGIIQLLNDGGVLAGSVLINVVLVFLSKYFFGLYKEETDKRVEELKKNSVIHQQVGQKVTETLALVSERLRHVQLS